MRTGERLISRRGSTGRSIEQGGRSGEGRLRLQGAAENPARVTADEKRRRFLPATDGLDHVMRERRVAATQLLAGAGEDLTGIGEGATGRGRRAGSAGPATLQ